MIRRVSAVLASFAVVASALMLGSSPANAAITGSASINPSEFAAGSSPEVQVTWTEGSAAATTSPGNGAFADPTGGNYLSVEVGWGWTFSKKNPTNTPVSYTANWVAATAPATGGAYECRDGGTTFASFASSGFGISSGSTLTCLVRRSSGGSDNPGQQVVLSNTGSAYFTLVAGSSIAVTFPAGTVTAPSSGPASDTWRVISLGTTTVSSTLIANGQTTTVTTTVPAPTDAEGNPIPLITINIDANGGQCAVTAVSGYQSTWANAPDSGNCTKSGAVFVGYNTSPDGTGLSIAPGGNLHLTGGNTLYAIYQAPRVPGAPTDVVATPGKNEVKISWKAPSDPGSNAISNYLVQATPSGRVCITATGSADPLSCTIALPATNTQYTFKAQALNNAGWGELSAASNAVSPFDVLLSTATRTQDKVLLIFKGGSTVSVSGRAPGLAPGTVITPQVKIGSGDWVSETRDLPRVAEDRSISWSKKFAKSLNGSAVEVRLAFGDVSSESASLKIGSRFGVPDAPRNIKVVGDRGGVRLSWEAPASDGGSPITSYVARGNVNGLTPFCRVVVGNPLSCVVPFNTSRVAAGMNLTFTVAAVSARGEGASAKASVRGPLRWVDIQTVGTGGAPGGKTELRLEVRTGGFEVGDAFTVELKIGADGPWKKQKGQLVISSSAGLSGSGDWSGIIPSEARKQGYTVRVVNPKAAPDAWTQKPRP